MAGFTRKTVLVLLAAALVLLPASAPAAEPSLAEIYSILKTKEFVDLTHTFDTEIPHWPGFPQEKRETIYWYDKGVGTIGYGFFAQVFSHVGQWGTHCDAPAHFARGKRTLDQIGVKEMLLPLVVFDVHEKAAANPDYALTL
ncbi:MAG: cyclase family protein, partial [Synergistales bacterium]|nr:cyclase family protein [Synergistales bacterium]